MDSNAITVTLRDVDAHGCEVTSLITIEPIPGTDEWRQVATNPQQCADNRYRDRVRLMRLRCENAESNHALVIPG